MSDRPLNRAEPAVRIDDVSKMFRLHKDRSTSLKQAFTRLGRADSIDDFWALRNVSFEVPKGATYGLIGHNGSGKSTMLRLIAGIHRPTKGSITTDGRISALLDLGAGFHPELTGRENVYLNGSILGLTRKDIDKRLDAIIEFAGLGEFIDAPVKVYSSGMYVRLGFSVAVNVEPDILIIDEVIAVGDEEFQRRCFDHLYSLRRRGLTILLVSHSHALMQQICDEIAWFDHGQLLTSGKPNDVVLQYLDHVNEVENDRRAGTVEIVEPEPRRGHGSGEITIKGVELRRPDGAVVDAAATGEPLVLRVLLHAATPVDDPVIGLGIHHDSGAHLAGPNTRLGGAELGRVEGDVAVDYVLDPCLLMPGTYRITVAAYDTHVLHPYDVRDQAYPLHVQPGPSRERFGLVDLQGRWEISAPRPVASAD